MSRAREVKCAPFTEPLGSLARWVRSVVWAKDALLQPLGSRGRSQSAAGLLGRAQDLPLRKASRKEGQP